MQLKERIALIIKENRLKHKEFAKILGISDSYVSTLLSGRNKNISNTLANNIENKFGYDAHWLLTGEGEKLAVVNNSDLGAEHNRTLMQLIKLPPAQIKAVMVLTGDEDKLRQVSNPDIVPMEQIKAFLVLTGEEDKFKDSLSAEHKKAIALLQKMPTEQIKAVLAFIDSLKKTYGNQ